MYLITGASGQLGQTFRSMLSHDQAYFADSRELDITCPKSIQKYIDAHQNISLIINCAAFTNVEKAEEDQTESRLVNIDGARNLAKTHIPLIHISTDYVFDGQKRAPYHTSDPVNPLNHYGQHKAHGEQAILETSKTAIIIRTSWLYSEYGNNFLKTILRLLNEKESLGVIYDQIGTPTYARHLAEAILHIAPQLLPAHQGIYHFANDQSGSWFDFAQEIQRFSNTNCRLSKILAKDYPYKAKRPAYSVLDIKKIKETFGVQTPHWHQGVLTCLKKLSS